MDQQAERVPVVYCAEPRRWPWHPSAVNSNVIQSVSILPVSIPTLLVFPLRMRQSNPFISSASPLTSFTVPGTGALMPRHRYVTPPPSTCACVNPIPSLLLPPPPPPLPVLPYLATAHRCLVVSVPVCNSFPLHSVLYFAEEAREGETSCLYLRPAGSDPEVVCQKNSFLKVSVSLGGFGPSVAHGKHSVRRRCVQATKNKAETCSLLDTIGRRSCGR